MKREAEEPATHPKTDELSETGSLTDMLQAALRDREDPLAQARRRQEALFLRQRIFFGLTDLQPSWDTGDIAYFRGDEFLVVLDRCAAVGVTVIGVEAFLDDATYLDTHFEDLKSDKSHVEFIKSFRNNSSLSFSASFDFCDVKLDTAEDPAAAGDLELNQQHDSQKTRRTFPSPQLVEAYRATLYKIHDRNESFTLCVGEHSEPLYDLYWRTGKSSALFITAYNPWSQEQEEGQNIAAQQALSADLLGWGAEHMFGGVGEDPTGVWTSEPSWLVLGVSVEDARRLGTEYRQNAVLWAGGDAVPRIVLPW